MILAIATAHDACSAALIADGAVVAAHHEVIGRGHDSRLALLVADLLGRTDGSGLSSIQVDVGPGSFTGIRIGLAMAQGLAIARALPCYGVASDRIVAAACFVADPGLQRLAVLLDGRRGEVFGRIHTRSAAIGDPTALQPEEANTFVADADAVAGNGAGPATGHFPGAPQAADMRFLSVHDLLPPRPVYVRPPDAKLPA